MTPGQALRRLRSHVKELKRRRDRGAKVTRISYSLNGEEIGFPVDINTVIDLSEAYATHVADKIAVQRAARRAHASE